MMATATKKIDGLICAPFTPFHGNGDLNLEIVPRYAGMRTNNGIIGVFVNGSSGEGPLLTDAERMACAEKWIEVARPNFKIIVSSVC